VPSLERATDLLANAGSREGIAAVLAELGFGAPLTLDDAACHGLGVPDAAPDARIAKGVGALRALTLSPRANTDSRQGLIAIAKALARNAPQLLWLVLSSPIGSDELTIMCWASSQSRPRISSLICRRSRLFESDAETVCALASARTDSDLLTHSRWLDILGREAITRRFFRSLEACVAELGYSLSGRIDSDERREIALLYVSRLIFLSFLETKGWLNADFGFLSNGYTRCIGTGGNYQRKILEPLFFGTLNTPTRQRSTRAQNFGRIPFLNGGLFSRSQLEKRRRDCAFTDESFGNTYGSLLSRYRFSGREDSADWSDASIDPEMLGKAFEALMGAGERKSSGAFYTPQSLVEDVVSEALNPADGSELSRLTSLRLLDPACGSGAFLVHALERLASRRLAAGESGSIADIRRRVLTTSIFGVDLNPMAVWLCELRLWLAIVIESAEDDPMKVMPLPNLDRHVRVGDSLAGGAFSDASRLRAGRRLIALRSRYMRVSGPRKRTLARELDRAERSSGIEILELERARLASVRKELLIAIRTRDLFGVRRPPSRDLRLRLDNVRSHLKHAAKRQRLLREGSALPFSFATHFSDAAANGGFDIIVANPPWVRLHQIPESSRDRLRREFTVYRDACWKSGSASSGAGPGFAAQIDISSLFVERSCELLRPAGTMALLLPSKLWRALAGGGVRRLLRERTDIIALDDMTESDPQFDAAVYPSLLVCRKKDPTHPTTPPATRAVVRFRDRVLRWTQSAESSAFDDTIGSPWLLLPPKARQAFERVREAGSAFADTSFGRPILGVKTGYNAAYVVRVNALDDGVASIASGNRVGAIEQTMLRPLLRGETLGSWRITGAREYLVWPHGDEDDTPLETLPPLAREWLLPFRDQLASRSDLRGRAPWWSVFRTDGATVTHPRVVWADFGVRPRAIVLPRGDTTVPLNSCYSVRCESLDDAHALAAILNGPLAAAWLNALAEPARGGYRRYLGWTMSLLPLPTDWRQAVARLAPLGERAMDGDIPSDAALLDAAIEAYAVDREEIEPLLLWTHQRD
jgi:N-6 DNA Methylase